MQEKKNNQPNVNNPFSPELIAVMKDDPVYPQLGHQSFPETTKRKSEAGNGNVEEQSSSNFPE
ncbi:hypothetical protein [Neobacillus niacini]|uniref:hypothetical protein n=1 Tax=Neobacillus niacini TaxID=86668 RepID=UPI0028628D0F|nr:hypothetical protein [Neobacillus niacini]MDR7002080.1 hypothetical protein [Neobacillus niacini]